MKTASSAGHDLSSVKFRELLRWSKCPQKKTCTSARSCLVLLWMSFWLDGGKGSRWKELRAEQSLLIQQSVHLLRTTTKEGWSEKLKSAESTGQVWDIYPFQVSITEMNHVFQLLLQLFSFLFYGRSELLNLWNLLPAHSSDRESLTLGSNPWLRVMLASWLNANNVKKEKWTRSRTCLSWWERRLETAAWSSERSSSMLLNTEQNFSRQRINSSKSLKENCEEANMEVQVHVQSQTSAYIYTSWTTELYPRFSISLHSSSDYALKYWGSSYSTLLPSEGVTRPADRYHLSSMS